MTKFKVGDKVRCIGDWEGAGYGWEKGKEFVVNKVQTCNIFDVSYFCYFPADDSGGIFEDHLELVEKSSSEFKIGDRIIVLETNTHYPEKFNGCIGTIINMDCSSIPYRIKFDKDNEGRIGYEMWVRKVQHLNESPNKENPLSSEGKMDIEKLKTFNPKNLVEGKKWAEDEKASYEASEAKKAYKQLIDEKEEQERVIKVANEKLEDINDKLNIFKSKK